MARVLLYASARLFGETLEACLRLDDFVEDAIVVYDVLEVAGRAKEEDVDVVLFDITSGQSLTTVRAVADDLPDTPVVALALSPDIDEVVACADAGLVGWVPRNASLDEVVGTVRTAIEGKTTCDPRLVRSLIEEVRRRRDPADSDSGEVPLTPREVETLRLMSRGLTNKEIATELHVSVATVKNHVHAVLGKLNLKRRSEARFLLSEKPWLLRSA